MSKRGISRERVREWNESRKRALKRYEEELITGAKLKRFHDKQERDKVIVVNGRLQWLVPRDEKK